MKKIITSAIIAMTLIATISGCKKEKDSTCTDGSANFAFLAIGNTSHYFLNYLGTYDTINYTLVSKKDGKYVLSATTNQGTIPTNSNGFWWACGNEFYESNGTPPANMHWYISLDAKVGDRWSRVEGNQTSNYQLISKSIDVTTFDLGQTFTNCYQFTYNGSGTFNVDTIYFKPQVGIVCYQGFLANYELIDKNF